MKKILVIEDEPQTRDIFLECLEAEGFDTRCAENGRVGLQKAQEQLPDLVICDIMMPEIDGYAVLSQMRHDPVTAIVPFIFLTGKASRTEHRYGMELGADDYLIKPCTAENLLRAIAVRLEKQEALRQWCAIECSLEPPATTTTTQAVPPSIFPCCPHLSEVFDFIENHYHQLITLCDVAQAVGYSPAYLTDMVRRQTGQTVHRWIVERRMAQARYLLLQTERAVNQIAEAVGYQDAGHFNRQFRQLYGVPPKAWRNKHRS